MASRGVRSDVPRYVDVRLRIRPGHGDLYSVVAHSSVGGDGEEDVRLPVPPAGADEQEAVRAFGQALFESVFVGSVRSVYDRTLAKQEPDQELRLVLDVTPPREVSPTLLSLPWEVLYDPDRGDYLNFRDATVVRYVALLEPVEPLVVEPPLRILGMVASPNDQVPLNVKDEQRRVAEALGAAGDRVELSWVEGQTRSDLVQKLKGADYHAFHFVGHGGVNQRTGEGFIALADKRGRTDRLTATDLARLVGRERHARLVVLNACEGARSEGTDPFAGTALKLVQRGIPAVVAMRDQISEPAAVAFAQAFYEGVADRKPVEAAVAMGRAAIHDAIPGTLEWATPALYLRASDGALRPSVPVRAPAWRRSRALGAAVALVLLSLVLSVAIVAARGRGEVLYQAGPEDGFARWRGTSDWQVANGMLVNDGSNDRSYIQLPYRSGRSDYAVEAEIQVVRLAGDHPRSCVEAEGHHKSFGIYFREQRDTPTGVLYFAVTYKDEAGGPPDCSERRAKITSFREGSNPPRTGGTTTVARNYRYVALDDRTFDPETDWHTYRVEADGRRLRVFIDGELKLEQTDNMFLSSDIVALFSRNVELNVRNVKLVAL